MRETLLQQMRHQRAMETPDMMEARLHHDRVYHQQRIATELPEERAARLEQLRVSQQQRIATELPEERAARLEQLRVSQQQRIATELPEVRAARLEQLRVLQQQRIASETPEENEERLRRDRECHMQHSHSLSSDQPLFHQPAVRSKISKFHSTMGALQMSTCPICMERFPAMTVRMTSAGSECVRCTRDKHIPNTYSAANNMIPGPVPPELMVRCNCLHFLIT